MYFTFLALATLFLLCWVILVRGSLFLCFLFQTSYWFIIMSSSLLYVFIVCWFRFLIYPRNIRETLATFLCCSYCGLCESLVRSLRSFPSHKLRVFKEKIFLHLDDHISCCHWSLKKHKRLCLYLVENPRKKESVDLELARSRVSRFYWWVAIRSRV